MFLKIYLLNTPALFSHLKSNWGYLNLYDRISFHNNTEVKEIIIIPILYNYPHFIVEDIKGLT